MKGAGYIKTYFVPLDENFNLIKKQDCLNYYRIHDRARYYNLRKCNFGDISDDESCETEPGYTNYDVRNLFIMEDSSIDGDETNITPRGSSVSYTSMETEIRETRC